MIDLTRNVQIIGAEGRPAFAVIPHPEWIKIAAYLKADDDERAYDRAKKDWLADQCKAYPAAVARKIAGGEHPVAVLRAWRGLTQKQLAAKTGLNVQTISHIETGVRKGGIATMRKIAKALKVSLELLTDAMG